MTRTQKRLLIGGGVAAVGVGLWYWYESQKTAANNAAAAKCLQLRMFAQQAQTADPAGKAALKPQVEALAGAQFLNDAEWQTWITAQANAPCPTAT